MSVASLNAFAATGLGYLEDEAYHRFMSWLLVKSGLAQYSLSVQVCFYDERRIGRGDVSIISTSM
jgi:hypothetical protein